MIGSKLWDEARANTCKALRFLAERFTPAQRAEALGMTMGALSKTRAPSRRPSMRLAARVARAARVNLEGVATGAWPGDVCPRRGRSSGGNTDEGCRPYCRRVIQAGEGAWSMPKLALDRSSLERLLNHATSAAQLVGHLDDAIAAGPVAEHVDAIVHELTELLGDPRALAAPDAAAPDDPVAYDGAPMLTSNAGGPP